METRRAQILEDFAKVNFSDDIKRVSEAISKVSFH